MRRESGDVAVTASETPGSESPGGENPVQGRLRRRRNILIGVVILALMASAGGLVEFPPLLQAPAGQPLTA